MDRGNLRWTETLSPVRREEEVAGDDSPIFADTDWVDRDKLRWTEMLSDGQR